MTFDACRSANLVFIGGEGPGETPDVIVSAVRARGRVQVVGGTLVTDKGTLLRAIDLPIDITPDFPIDHALFQNIAHQEGLNAVMLYLEHWDNTTGSHLAQAERVVDEARQAGLYVILGIGGGPGGDGHPGNGWFDIEKVRSFWQFYAPRFKDETHVFYQIQNQPELVCNAPWQTDTIDMEREAYSLIRSLAPDTHVVLFSYRDVPTGAALADSIERVADRVDWSNASVGMEGFFTCVTPAEMSGTFAIAAGLRAPVVITGMPVDTWAQSARALESAHLGWTNMRWLAAMPDFSTFHAEHEQAGLTWCPDFGTWPEDSAKCNGP